MPHVLSNILSFSLSSKQPTSSSPIMKYVTRLEPEPEEEVAHMMVDEPTSP